MSTITLTDVRELAGLSKIGLDELADLPRGTVHDIESGRNKKPSHEVVTKIVRALRAAGFAGVMPEVLFPVADDSRESVAP